MQAVLIVLFNYYLLNRAVDGQPVDLDVSAYAGRWYSMYINEWVSWIFKGYCPTAFHKMTSNMTLDFYNSMREESPRGVLRNSTGTLTVVDPNRKGSMKMKYENSSLPISWPYNVIKVGPVRGSEYQFAVVTGFLKSLVVYARDPIEFKLKYDSEVTAFLNSIGFDKFPLRPVPSYQGEDCPRWVHEVDSS